MENKTKILIVDDDLNTLSGMKAFLEQNPEYQVFTTPNPQEALEIIKSKTIDLLLTDLKMPNMNGKELMKKAHEIDETIQIIMITAYGSIETAVEAMKEGAYDFITKPVNLDELELTIKRAIDVKNLKIDNLFYKQTLENKYSISNIIGNSKAMEDVYRKILAVAPTNANVLIEGESGTGKELVAKAIHFNSPRKNKRFVALHCAALAEGLLESELFGHEKGAFTGAVSRKIGRFEYADGGTLFLDEISELNQKIQVKLLRVLQERVFERVGSTEPIKVDVRIISATNKNLKEAVEKGEFREDLYYRLKVVSIYVPPLRARKEDIPLLIKHFLNKFNKLHNKNVEFVTNEALEAMKKYDWPGNVRELENTIESIVILSRSNKITLKDLPENILQARKILDPEKINIENNEKELILRTLKQVSNNKTKAAQLLGISRKTLHRKLKKYSIES